jgi:hypothetical protein
MPINTNLNRGPWNDDFNISKQFYRVLFKPRFAVQARELTQIQSILQNQIEQFGDNIFQEGSIIKGCNFTELNDLEFVKLVDRTGFDVLNYLPTSSDGVDVFYELEGQSTGLRAAIIFASRGFQTRPPDLNTFYINYLNSNIVSEIQRQVFETGEELKIIKISVFSVEEDGNTVEQVTTEEVDVINVTQQANHVGKSFGLTASEGVVFQRGHFLFASEQLVIVSKYNNQPDRVSVGYVVDESIVTALQDGSLFDNAAGSPNENAPGADRLKLSPRLVAIDTDEADEDTQFFTLIRYENGSAVQIRDVSQYNVIGEEMAKRTFEESGNYIVQEFNVKTIERNGDLKVSIGPGVAYIRGYRVENRGEVILDIDQVEGTETQNNQPVPFDYGGYVNILDATGQLPIGSYSRVELRNGANTEIGSAIVNNYTPDKVFLFDVRMDTGSFTDVKRITSNTGIVVVANNTVNPIIKEPRNSAMVFDTGMFSLKTTDDISLPIRESVEFSGVTDTITITGISNEDFVVQNDDILVVDSTNADIDVLSYSVSTNGKILTINIDPTNSGSGTVYFNKRLQVAEPHSKDSVELYANISFVAVGSEYSSNTTDYNTETRYNLGFPDVYEIVEITDSLDGVFTNSFRLVTNQKDNYYDHSYIELIPGRPMPSTGAILVRMKAFKVNTDIGEYFFSVNSYPSEMPANDIPVFTSSSGRTYNLRDCLDFRPHVAPLGSYTATTPATASVIASPDINLVPVFSGSFVIPALRTTATLDYEYYLNRTDLLAIDSYGKFSLTKGREGTFSRPEDVGDKLMIAEVYLPGFPALTPEIAAKTNKNQYSTRIKSGGVKNYTMKDIDKMSKMVDRLSYYATLSTLETSTQNLSILDENGLSRFKNGIIVDPFNDLSIADVKNVDFNAAIDFTEKTLSPAVKTIPLNLKIKTSSNATLFPDNISTEVASISRDTDVSVISQRYATSFRNCVSNFYSYIGSGFVFPEYDGAYDVVNTPATNITVDLLTPISNFVDNIQEFLPLTSTSSTVISSLTETATTRRAFGHGTLTTTTEQVTEILSDVTRSLQVLSGGVREQKIGDFVTNFQFNPFMRSREVNVLMFGLRPNTRHFVFFDEVDVNSTCAPGTIENTVRDVQRAGNFGDPILSNENGIASVVLLIPENSFFVGDRKIFIADVDAFADIESASTSKGSIVYRAYNFSVEKSGAVLSTRQPEFNIVQTATNRTVTNRPVVTQEIYRDPIAQTFFIKQAMGRGSDTIFASKLDLYFKRRSEINGVTVMLREVVNGYPSNEIIPFSKVHLTPDMVSTSDDGVTPTTVFFTTPIRLDVEKEYAIVVEPDAADPDYLIFVSRVGGTDIASGSAVVQDWGDGVLFTSTNNRAWTSYQDEDLKFTLYRHDFDSSQATITFTNDDHEFLSIGSLVGLRFLDGEIVYAEKGSSSNVSVSFASSTLGGTIPDINNGDFIILEYLNQKIVAKVVQNTGTDGGGNPIVIIDRPSTFKTVGGDNYTGTVTAKPVVKGSVVYFNFRNPNEIVLEKSSARSGRVFAASDIIYGLNSGASATVSSVDNTQISYFQPMIFRTTDSVSKVSLSGLFTDPSDTDVSYGRNLVFNDKNRFNNRGVTVFSKSNNLTSPKPFDITVTLENSGNRTSTPIVDVETAMIFAYQYKITNTPATSSRYVSNVVELAENFDSEDFRLYITGYRPLGTDIKAFVRLQNAADPLLFESNNWIELEMISGNSTFSSTSNINDFREFVYQISDANKTLGVATYTNSSGTYEGYRKFAIKIEMTSENIFSVPRLNDYRGIALL